MAEKTINEASEHVVEEAGSVASSTPSATWRGWLWDSVDVSKEERRFLLKVCG
jgi:MFS transporter, ACS family, pantothenate transporter